ncbi:MAG: Ig-like domain-containing protein, partial [Ginsengibacter sp.]
ISIAAMATDSDGTVSKIDFYNGSTLLGSDNTSPYTYSWSNVAAGSYTITAKATDNSGTVTTSTSVAVSVNAPANVAPAVKMISPVTSSTFTSPASIAISADASDIDGTIAKVEFYNGTTLIQTENIAPYAFTWSNVAAGSYTITAKATDDKGAVTISASVAVSVTAPVVANVAPVVALTSPAADASFTSPATISIAATATDADGTVSKVEFYNGSTLIGSDNTSPYTYSWSNVAAGSYTITAKATDNDGAVKTSASVAVNVTAPVVANVAPVVALTSPAANASFTSPATISIAAAATDSDGTVSNVDFYNGSTLLGSDNTSPYTYSWNNVAAGSYTITAKATDDKGAVTTSASVAVSVTAPVNVAPVVKITSPTNNSTFKSASSITISASASDIDGQITMVRFYSELGLIKTEYSAPYIFSTTSLPVGTHTLIAKATDNRGAVTTSESVTITINEIANIPPTVILTSPKVGATFTSQANIRITANAADADGTIKKVMFYNGSTLIKTENYAPYDFTWSIVSAGTYTITARAVDNDGAITRSTTVTVTVNEPASLTAAVGAETVKLASETQSPSISVSPNPVFNTMNVSTKMFKNNEAIFVSILSSTGNILQTMKIASPSQSFKVDVSSLVNGSYFVQAVSGNQKAIYQFIKQ